MMSSFPHLDSFIHIYFGQDFDLIADNMEDLVADFARSSSPDDIRALRADIARFFQQADVESAFKQVYENDIDPHAWHHTADSFLRRVDFLLSNNNP
ncbi:uncharacterized protein sS8_2170 [Methylocaldum marinum]|uniref:CdiI immunity protein domain-containing protein n=1 Tax=Methylocaldum marinum TaxID=1432792 RepID=A0A250KRE4_9GAMM|nr:contact-dependent growth inhibition system immunity protein [Methylocaldum marinum]BBA34122.1 uncharacterized protein sS8_2170 [Methylocaldum marinum]